MKTFYCVITALGAATLSSVTVAAQDYNYVPGWSLTENHRYKGEKRGEWAAKTELFAKLRGRGPAADCTLKNLSEADGNVIVNRYRSNVRKTNEASALRTAHQQVDLHHRQFKAQGKCR